MYNKKEKVFIFLTSVFSVIHACGYVCLGIFDNFNICIIAMIIFDLLYIPASLIKSNKIYPYYLVLFSIILVFITAFTTSELFNNYSGLLCLMVEKIRHLNIFFVN